MFSCSSWDFSHSFLNVSRKIWSGDRGFPPCARVVEVENNTRATSNPVYCDLYLAVSVLELVPDVLIKVDLCMNWNSNCCGGEKFRNKKTKHYKLGTALLSQLLLTCGLIILGTFKPGSEAHATQPVFFDIYDWGSPVGEKEREKNTRAGNWTWFSVWLLPLLVFTGEKSTYRKK